MGPGDNGPEVLSREQGVSTRKPQYLYSRERPQGALKDACDTDERTETNLAGVTITGTGHGIMGGRKSSGVLCEGGS